MENKSLPPADSYRPRIFAAGIHLLALLTWIIGPLVVMWLSRSDYLKEHARHAANWQLTFGIGMYVAGFLSGIAVLFSDFRPAIRGPIIGLIMLGGTLLFTAVAVVRALQGKVWEYPVAFRIKETTSVSRTF